MTIASAKRAPRQNQDQGTQAEQSVLGGLLLDSTCFDRVADIITADDFVQREHRLIYNAISALCKEGGLADIITVPEWLERRGELHAAGGLAYLGALANNTPGTANIVAYASLVRDSALRNTLSALGKELTTKATTAEHIAEVLAHVEQRLGDVRARQLSDATGSVLTLTRGSDLKPEPIRWLWDGWLARGKLHILAGSPGSGKTTIALALAAIVTTGGRWPDGKRCESGNVLIWSGEDDPRDTLLPRLLAQGADRNRVFFVGDVRDGDEKRSFDPARDMQALLIEATRIGDVRFLLVDPVVNAVAGDSHKNTEVRRALQPLVELSARLDAVALGISHFSKGTAGRDPIDRVTGSIAFGALARLVFATAKASDGEGQTSRLFARAKSNIGPDGGGFNYSIEQTELRHFSGVFTSYILWGNQVEGSARDLLADVEAIEDGGERSERDEAAEWLRELLAEGPMSAKDVQKHAKEAAISWATVRRAKDVLGIKPAKTRFDGNWEWKLPPKVPTHSPQDAHPKNMSTFGDDEHLREFPERNTAPQDAHVSTLETTEHLRENQTLSTEGAQDAQRGECEHVERLGTQDGMEDIPL